MTCKPCITIKAMYQLAKIHYKNFREDLKQWKQVNQLACEIKPYDDSWLNKRMMEDIRKVREQAKENYNPDTAMDEYINKPL